MHFHYLKHIGISEEFEILRNLRFLLALWSFSLIHWQVYWNFTFHISRIQIINSWAPRSNEDFHLSLQASVFRSELQWLEINAYYENSGNITERKSWVIYRTSPWGLQKLLIWIWLGPVYRGILPEIPFLICVWLLWVQIRP